ncbi:hypothetical protein T265_03224 [Opisthorchis viverrini]|uniref:Ribosomal protein L14p/L23e n=1 Tax=Opisthorchis viverrini TaxID=6198 RepID=A0A075AHQ0_OPIVI|nr:hypothetical protein T265_03224 [Opisthorchis viverrini]KER30269.1 hypothetical protein T265_03224 [Opisthorchis viverrini]
MFRIVTSPLILRPLALKSVNTSCAIWTSQIKPHKITSCVPTILTSTIRLSSGPTKSSSAAEGEIDSADVESSPTVDKQSQPSLRKNYQGKLYAPVDLSTSLDYMNSEGTWRRRFYLCIILLFLVYLNTYWGKPVWFYYRRNHKGHFPPPRTRRNCVNDRFPGRLNEHEKYSCTLYIPGLCEHQHKKLLLEVAKAQDLGTIETWLPFHLYDYSEYYSYLPEEQLKELLRVSGCAPQNIMDDRGSLDVTHASSADLAELPANLQNLLGSIDLIPRASLGQPPPPETKIVPPRIPNRYKMEEDHKALVAKRRKSLPPPSTFILFFTIRLLNKSWLYGSEASVLNTDAMLSMMMMTLDDRVYIMKLLKRMLISSGICIELGVGFTRSTVCAPPPHLISFDLFSAFTNRSTLTGLSLFEPWSDAMSLFPSLIYSTRTSVNVGHGPLCFVAPQTRLRVVDNSAWSNIAPAIGDAKKRQPNVKTDSRSGTSQSGGDVQSMLMSLNKSLSSKPALCIRVYTHNNKGKIGDKVLVAVGGQKKKGWIVGTRQQSRDGWPRFESNNIVLVDDEGNPLGTRILVPVPAKLRSLSGDISKILSIATTFV